jgi:hypothetical protein
MLNDLCDLVDNLRAEAEAVRNRSRTLKDPNAFNYESGYAKALADSAQRLEAVLRLHYDRKLP